MQASRTELFEMINLKKKKGDSKKSAPGGYKPFPLCSGQLFK
jgi:hypothetical protein